MNIKYIIIPSNILFDFSIPLLSKILYGQIKVLSYKSGFCEVTNNFLAKNNNCSKRTIIRMLNILKEKNYIEIIDGGRRKLRVVGDSVDT